MTTTTTTALPTGTWELDAAATTVTVSVKKLGFLTVPGTLSVTSGSIEIDDNHRVRSVAVTAAAGSYDSNNAKRDEHVASPDFLDADNHPEIVFQSGAVLVAGDGWKTSGTLTVKGQTAPIDIVISDVKYSETSATFSASATVDRNAIGVDKMPGFVIGRDLTLSVNAKATRVSQ